MLFLCHHCRTVSHASDRWQAVKHVQCNSLLAAAFLCQKLSDLPGQTISGGEQACSFACAEQLFGRLLSSEL